MVARSGCFRDGDNDGNLHHHCLPSVLIPTRRLCSSKAPKARLRLKIPLGSKKTSYLILPLLMNPSTPSSKLFSTAPTNSYATPSRTPTSKTASNATGQAKFRSLAIKGVVESLDGPAEIELYAKARFEAIPATAPLADDPRLVLRFRFRIRRVRKSTSYSMKPRRT